MLLDVKDRVRSILTSLTVEPIMLVDGACKEAMLIFIENVQMNKICSVRFGYSSEVCNNLKDYPEYSVRVQREYSIFAFYNSVIISVVPLIYVLFMGAWSDKYGRKFPLLLGIVGHACNTGGYLLVNWQSSWPVEYLLIVAFIDALGGGSVGVQSSATSYISDITDEKQRTPRLNIITSLWYLGGPLGTLLTAVIIRHSGYNLALGLTFLANLTSFLYILCYVKETHGPFAKKPLSTQEPQQQEYKEEKVTMVKMLGDYFNWRRLAESLQTLFKKRDGNTRFILIATILSNMIRRAAKTFYMYMFVRRVFEWDATDYGYWITYRHLLVSAGTFLLVPILIKKFTISDYALVLIGSFSIVGEYVIYGMAKDMTWEPIVWLGPVIGLISNATIISLRSISTKLVGGQEKGRVSGVLYALTGLMPMMGYATYAPIYYNTVEIFPGAQFFVGAIMNLTVFITFLVMKLMGMWPMSSKSDTEELLSIPDDDTDKSDKYTEATLKSIANTLTDSGSIQLTHSQTQTQDSTDDKNCLLNGTTNTQPSPTVHKIGENINGVTGVVLKSPAAEKSKFGNDKNAVNESSNGTTNTQLSSAAVPKIGENINGVTGAVLDSPAAEKRKFGNDKNAVNESSNGTTNTQLSSAAVPKIGENINGVNGAVLDSPAPVKRKFGNDKNGVNESTKEKMDKYLHVNPKNGVSYEDKTNDFSIAPVQTSEYGNSLRDSEILESEELPYTYKWKLKPPTHNTSFVNTRDIE